MTGLWAAARALAAAIRARYSAGTTGQRWRRPQQECPPWCAKDHRCTAAWRSGGEHRSDPIAWRQPYGCLVVTRVAHRDGRQHMETRVVARLSTDDDAARVQAQHLLVGIDLTVRAVLGVAEVNTGSPERPRLLAGAR